MNPTPLFLLADDDTDDQEFFLDALREINTSIECMITGDGIEALEKLLQKDTRIPDFIFLDQNMPRMNGLQCLREIKKINVLRDVPIVMYSTTHLDKDHEEAQRLGATHFFKKTPSFNQLVAYLKSLLEQ